MSELSKTNGTTTSANNRAEVTHISRNGLILWVKDREYYLPYDKFPWFKRAAVDDVFNVQLLADSLGCFRCRFELVYHSKSR